MMMTAWQQLGGEVCTFLIDSVVQIFFLYAEGGNLAFSTCIPMTKIHSLSVANRHKKRKVNLSNLNLPGVLRYVTCSAGRGEDILTLLRGTVCQALLYNNNTKARNAAKEGTMKDMAQGIHQKQCKDSTSTVLY